MNLRTMARLLMAAILVAAVIVLALNRNLLDVWTVEQFINRLGIWAPIGHVVLFALCTVLFAPGWVFGIAGGALFGTAWGMLLNLTGAMLGTTAAFLVARYIAADWVRARAGDRVERVISGFEAEGWRLVVLARPVPLVPFSFEFRIVSRRGAAPMAPCASMLPSPRTRSRRASRTSAKVVSGGREYVSHAAGSVGIRCRPRSE